MVHFVQLKTLKQCFAFLLRLHERKGINDIVHTRLLDDFASNYKNLNRQQCQQGFFSFLGNVKAFYQKLTTVNVSNDVVDIGFISPSDILDALVECIPKFLAAVYYLLYHVDSTYNGFGGGSWGDLYPGYISYSGYRWGGELDTYLTAPSSKNDYGVLPGGFEINDLTSNYRYGYSQGKNMINDLRSILEKSSGMRNFFRDVVFMVLNRYWQDVNAANVIGLAKVFCNIVNADKRKDKNDVYLALKQLPNKGNNCCIDWDQLQKVCDELKSAYEGILGSGFDITGVLPKLGDLQSAKFATRFATWYRDDYTGAWQTIKKIKAEISRNVSFTPKQIADKFLFRNGFCLGDQKLKGASKDFVIAQWASFIEKLVDDENGLEKLKKVLDGTVCASHAARPASSPKVVRQPSDSRALTSQPSHVSLAPSHAAPQAVRSSKVSHEQQGSRSVKRPNGAPAAEVPEPKVLPANKTSENNLLGKGGIRGDAAQGLTLQSPVPGGKAQDSQGGVTSSKHRQLPEITGKHTDARAESPKSKPPVNPAISPSVRSGSRGPQYKQQPTSRGSQDQISNKPAKPQITVTEQHKTASGPSALPHTPASVRAPGSDDTPVGPVKDSSGHKSLSPDSGGPSATGRSQPPSGRNVDRPSYGADGSSGGRGKQGSHSAEASPSNIAAPQGIAPPVRKAGSTSYPVKSKNSHVSGVSASTSTSTTKAVIGPQESHKITSVSKSDSPSAVATVDLLGGGSNGKSQAKAGKAADEPGAKPPSAAPKEARQDKIPTPSILTQHRSFEKGGSIPQPGPSKRTTLPKNSTSESLQHVQPHDVPLQNVRPNTEQPQARGSPAHTSPHLPKDPISAREPHDMGASSTPARQLGSKSAVSHDTVSAPGQTVSSTVSSASGGSGKKGDMHAGSKALPVPDKPSNHRASTNSVDDRSKISAVKPSSPGASAGVRGNIPSQDSANVNPKSVTARSAGHPSSSQASGSSRVASQVVDGELPETLSTTANTHVSGDSKLRSTPGITHAPDDAVHKPGSGGSGMAGSPSAPQHVNDSLGTPTAPKVTTPAITGSNIHVGSGDGDARSAVGARDPKSPVAPAKQVATASSGGTVKLPKLKSSESLPSRGQPASDNTRGTDTIAAAPSESSYAALRKDAPMSFERKALAEVQRSSPLLETTFTPAPIVAVSQDAKLGAEGTHLNDEHSTVKRGIGASSAVQHPDPGATSPDTRSSDSPADVNHPRTTEQTFPTKPIAQALKRPPDDKDVASDTAITPPLEPASVSDVVVADGGDGVTDRKQDVNTRGRVFTDEQRGGVANMLRSTRIVLSPSQPSFTLHPGQQSRPNPTLLGKPASVTNSDALGDSGRTRVSTTAQGDPAAIAPSSTRDSSSGDGLRGTASQRGGDSLMPSVTPMSGLSGDPNSVLNPQTPKGPSVQLTTSDTIRQGGTGSKSESEAETKQGIPDVNQQHNGGSESGVDNGIGDSLQIPPAAPLATLVQPYGAAANVQRAKDQIIHVREPVELKPNPIPQGPSSSNLTPRSPGSAGKPNNQGVELQSDIKNRAQPGVPPAAAHTLSVNVSGQGSHPSGVHPSVGDKVAGGNTPSALTMQNGEPLRFGRAGIPPANLDSLSTEDEDDEASGVDGDLSMAQSADSIGHVSTGQHPGELQKAGQPQIKDASSSVPLPSALTGDLSGAQVLGDPASSGIGQSNGAFTRTITDVTGSGGGPPSATLSSFSGEVIPAGVDGGVAGASGDDSQYSASSLKPNTSLSDAHSPPQGSEHSDSSPSLLPGQPVVQGADLVGANMLNPQRLPSQDTANLDDANAKRADGVHSGVLGLSADVGQPGLSSSHLGNKLSAASRPTRLSNAIVRDNLGVGASAEKSKPWWTDSWDYKADLKEKWEQLKNKEEEALKKQAEADSKQQKGLQDYLRHLQPYKTNYVPYMHLPIPEPSGFAVDGEVVEDDSDTEQQRQKDLIDLHNARHMESLRLKAQRDREERMKLQKEAVERYKKDEEERHKTYMQNVSDPFTGIVAPNARGLSGNTLPTEFPHIGVAVGYPIKQPRLPRNTVKSTEPIKFNTKRPTRQKREAPPIHNDIPKISWVPPPPIKPPPAPPPQPLVDFEVEQVYKAKSFQNDLLKPSHMPVEIIDPMLPYDNYLGPPQHVPLPEGSVQDVKTTATVDFCLPAWTTEIPTNDLSDIPETQLFPLVPPRTVRDMLRWLVGIRNQKHLKVLEKCINEALGSVPGATTAHPKLCVNNSKITTENVIDALKMASMFSCSVLSAIEPEWRQRMPSSTANAEDTDQDQGSDGCALLCRLRDYVYACHHQLTFLKSQCARDKLDGGWMTSQFGLDVGEDSPIQSFLTDDWNSKFETHLFNPCDVCLKSRIRMGFRKDIFSKIAKNGSYLSFILSPPCSGDDPLLTLSSYLNCITRRTPRTTGELVSFFHHFGNELHQNNEDALSPLGAALSTSHDNCPNWDHLDGSDLDAARELRGSNASEHDHADTMSTLLGCAIDDSQCVQLLWPITYRAYAIYSPCFAHSYLSWTVYLSDILRESLDRLRYDIKRHEYSKCASIHHCRDACSYLYFHGFTPPRGMSLSLVKCSDIVGKLEEVVSGGPVGKLLTCMDAFFYGIRRPFIFLGFTFWSVALILLTHTTLYRLDVLRVRSHFMPSRGSHVIDVKALLAHGTKMPSLYDIKYFDDEALAHAWNRIY